MDLQRWQVAAEESEVVGMAVAFVADHTLVAGADFAEDTVAAARATEE